MNTSINIHDVVKLVQKNKIYTADDGTIFHTVGIAITDANGYKIHLTLFHDGTLLVGTPS